MRGRAQVNPLDILLLLLLLIPSGIGLWKGIAGPACVLGALALGGWLSLRYAEAGGALLSRLGVAQRWAPLLAFFLLLAGALLLGALAARLLLGTLQLARLRWLDRLGGATLGLAAGVVASTLLVTAAAGLSPGAKDPQDGSLLAPHVLRAAQGVLLPILPEKWRERLAPHVLPPEPSTSRPPQ